MKYSMKYLIFALIVILSSCSQVYFPGDLASDKVGFYVSIDSADNSVVVTYKKLINETRIIITEDHTKIIVSKLRNKQLHGWIVVYDTTGSHHKLAKYKNGILKQRQAAW